MLLFYHYCSCLIARNLMGDLKTCMEVHNALEHFEKKLSAQGIGNSQDDGCDTQSNKVYMMYPCVTSCSKNTSADNDNIFLYFWLIHLIGFSTNTIQIHAQKR